MRLAVSVHIYYILSAMSDAGEKIARLHPSCGAWFALQIPTGAERQIVNACRVLFDENQVKILHFTMETLKRYGGVWHKEVRPMFPGYLIFEGDPGIVSERLRGLVAFNRVLKNNGEFKPLRNSEVEFLKGITDETLCARLSEGYIEGENVVVTDGPMVNFAGKIKKIDRHKRMALLEAEMFGRPIEFKLGFEVITRC